MTGYATRLCIMDLKREFGSNLSALNIDKVDVVGSGMDHCPESHRVGHLSVEPNVLIRGEQPCKLGADDSNNVAQHRYKDKGAIKGENETSPTRNPDGIFQAVESSQARISFLREPSISKEKKMGAIEENVEEEPPGSKEFALEPVFTHDFIIIILYPVPARRYRKRMRLSKKRRRKTRALFVYYAYYLRYQKPGVTQWLPWQ